MPSPPFPAPRRLIPRVYEADTSPHSWKPPVEVDPSSLDAPYSSYSAVGTTQLSYDGTCNPMPGWKPSFNPSTDIGCRVRALSTCSRGAALQPAKSFLSLENFASGALLPEGPAPNHTAK